MTLPTTISRPRLIALVIAPLAALTLAGCGSSSDAGVYRSTDGGQSFIPSSQLGVEDSFANREVTALGRSPLNPNAVYAGLSGNGIVVSADGGKSWTQSALASGTVYDFALGASPNEVYAAYEAQLIKTIDGGTTFETLYADPSIVRAVALTSSDPKSIWIGTEAGQLLSSTDGGTTWRVANSFKRAVVAVFVSPVDGTVYAASDTDQVVVSADGGQTFAEVEMDDPVFAFAQASTAGSPVLAATAKGLLMTLDSGKTWAAMSDPLSAAGQPLNDVYVLPGDAKTIAIAAAANVSVSRDGGVTWQSRAVPTRRQVSSVIIFSSETILVGVAGEGPSFLEQTLGS